MLTLRLLSDCYTVWQLPHDAPVPMELPAQREFTCVIRTATELSGVCHEADAPAGSRQQTGWRCLAFVGPFDLALTGIMVQVAQPLAQAGVPIFTLATYDTDYVLVPEQHLDTARQALQAVGIHVEQA